MKYENIWATIIFAIITSTLIYFFTRPTIISPIYKGKYYVNNEVVDVQTSGHNSYEIDYLVLVDSVRNVMRIKSSQADKILVGDTVELTWRIVKTPMARDTGKIEIINVKRLK